MIKMEKIVNKRFKDVIEQVFILVIGDDILPYN